MRIRSIKPEFWSSEDVAALPWDARLLFIGLWSYVDDNGVGRDVEKLIAADLFPLEEDPRDTLATVSRGLLKLSEAGLIARYTVDDKPFLHVTSWAKHQRIDKPAKGRYPLPTSEDAVPRDTLATPSRQSPEIPAPGTEEQRNRGTGEQDLLSDESDEPDLFGEFWKLYPRKDAKQDAIKAWKQITKTEDPAMIVKAVAVWPFKETRSYNPMPATWLRGKRWEDEATTLPLGGAETLSRQEIDNLIGPWIGSTPQPPPDVVDTRAWHRQQSEQRNAERLRLALAKKAGLQ